MTASANFKREFKDILHQVLVVYPNARIREAPGGIILHESHPPLPKTTVPVSLPGKAASALVDKSEG